MTLTEFLLARITEDEAVAREATQPTRWFDTPARDWPETHNLITDRCSEHEGEWFAMNLSAGDAAHIARHDPARVLAECEAKRRIVEIHQDGGESQGYLEDGYADIPHCCNACGEFGEYGVPWPCGTIKALALPYADHPDYRPEWKP